MLLIVLLWFGISAPLSAIGSYIGARQGVRTSPILVDRIGSRDRSECKTPRAGESDP